MESMNIQDSFAVFPCHSIRPVSLLLLLHVLYFTLQFAPLAVNSTFLLFELAVSAASHRHCQPILLSPPFTPCLYSPDLLFPLLVFDFTSQYHASCAFFLVLTSCLAFFPGPPPASRRLQQYSLNCTASDEKLSAHVNSRGVRAKAETHADLRGWSEHSRVRTYKLVGHTLARVTLPVTCTVSYIVAVNKKFTYRASSTYVVRINPSPYHRYTLCVQLLRTVQVWYADYAYC